MVERSAEWVMTWTDLILDSSALREAAHKGDLDEVRVRARAIASRAKRHGHDALAVSAAVLVERMGFQQNLPRSVYVAWTEVIGRHVDAIGHEFAGS